MSNKQELPGCRGMTSVFHHADTLGWAIGTSYVTRPKRLSAVQWTGDNLFQAVSVIESSVPDIKSRVSSGKWEDYSDIVEREGLVVNTVDGNKTVAVGEYVVRDMNGNVSVWSEVMFNLFFMKS